MKIEIGRRARRQVERASSWWHNNRPAAASLFDDELEDALHVLSAMPNAGVRYPTPGRPALRRLLLPKNEYHLYFALERSGSVIAIHSLWGARRERTPKL